MRTIQKCKPERQIARDLCETTYFTGRACKNGHVSPRNTVDASCVACRRVQRESGMREWGQEYMRRKRRIQMEIDPEETRLKNRLEQRTRRLLNPEKIRERERIASRIRRQQSPAAKLAEVRKRQAAKLKRTPPWADFRAIREFYENCPPGYEVDHIVPLRGDRASGLHVLSNLQYLTPKQNKTKGNRVTDALLRRIRREMLTELAL